MNNFTHLHTHSEYSILDGYTKIEQLAKIAHDLGQEKVACTDHGSLGGALAFWKSCKEAEVQAIQGMEGYITYDLNLKAKGIPTWHIILLAKNRRGLDNLFEISRIGWTEGFYSKPRIDHGTLKAHSEGLVVTSACMAGEVSRAIAEKDIDLALCALERYQDILGEDFYVELQPGNTKELNTTLAELADWLKIKTIVAVDSHHDKAENKSIQEMLLTIQQISSMKKSDIDYAKLMAPQAKSENSIMGKLNVLWPNRGLRYDKLELYLMSREEVVERMNQQGFDGNELADRTLEIAEKCEPVEFKLGTSYLPKGTPDPEMSSEWYLRKLVMQGLTKKNLITQEYKDRVEEELQVIADKNFSDYFLIVWDLINEARSRNIYVGPGRGSAAGSLICYALGITSMDPIEYGLLFFRFINPERNDYPDIDMDFEHTRRDEMKLYFQERWLHTLNISTYTQYHGKSLIKSLARVLAIPLGEADAITKHFDSIDGYEESDNDKVISFRNRYPEVLLAARKLDGHITASGAHAAGVVVADRPMNFIGPIESRTDPNDKKKRIPVLAFDMNDAADIGLQKFDFLSLANLTNIHDCIDMIKERHGIDIDWENLTPNDSFVLDELSRGNTVGVFQMESSPYRKLLVEMGVDSFEDLVASNALVRPGAFLTVAKDYINRKRGKEKVSYPHEICEPFLKTTYGVYIYQEQVMQMVVHLGGFSWAEADKLRKIIGKKLAPTEFAPWYNKWIEGATRYITEKQAAKIWKDFEKHSGYSFNRSHAVAYSYVGYVTAWLKIHYPTEFIYALLKSEKKDTNRMTYLLEAKRLGIQVLAPDINLSGPDMQMEGEALRFGLGDIKNVGSAAYNELINKRPFVDWDDFTERITATKCNSKVIASLVAVDALRAIPGAPYCDDSVSNYQEYLNYPVALESISEIGIDSVNIEDLPEEGFALVIGVSKNIKRTDTYMRLDIEDMTGVITCFGTSGNDLKDGEVIIGLVGDKSLLCYARVQGLLHRRDNNNMTDFERLILTQELWEPYKILFDFDYGGIDAAKSLVIPISVKQVITKAQKRMCFSYIIDSELNIEKLTIFPAQWPSIEPLLHEWEPVCVKLSPLRDGTGKTLWSDNIIDAKEIVRRKEQQ